MSQYAGHASERKLQLKGWGWLILAIILLAVLVGLGSAIFLAGLQWIVEQRKLFFWLLLLAPLTGWLTGFIYTRVSSKSAPGNSLIVTSLRHEPGHEPGSPNRILARLPALLAPLIVLTTWLAHLTGASVGREGTAVQMGGGLSRVLGKWMKIENARAQWHLLAAGVAAGFGSVFGVPWAGAVFVLELAGALSWRTRPLSQTARTPQTVVICLFASFLADFVTRATGVGHAHYPRWNLSRWTFDPLTLVQQPNQQNAQSFIFFIVLCIFSSVAFGWFAWGFLYTLRWFKKKWARMVPREEWRPALGGVLVAGVYFAPWLDRYCSLGTGVIAESFEKHLPFQDALLKSAFTVYSIGVGFRGGEVTPLFFMGSAMGSAIAGVFNFPAQVLASMGLVAVFGAAAGVPVTCAVMGAELFGWASFPFLLAVCVLSSKVCKTARLYDQI